MKNIFGLTISIIICTLLIGVIGWYLHINYPSGWSGCTSIIYERYNPPVNFQPTLYNLWLFTLRRSYNCENTQDNLDFHYYINPIIVAELACFLTCIGIALFEKIKQFLKKQITPVKIFKPTIYRLILSLIIFASGLKLYYKYTFIPLMCPNTSGDQLSLDHNLFHNWLASFTSISGCHDAIRPQIQLYFHYFVNPIIFAVLSGFLAYRGIALIKKIRPLLNKQKITN